MKWEKILLETAEQMTKLQANMPIQDAAIIASELKVELPGELIDFYSETNGIVQTLYVAPTNEWIEIGALIWSVEELITQNKAFRTNEEYKRIYMPFDNLLFIGDFGNGDCFAYSIHEGRIGKTDIYAWNHEDDSRTWVAPDLETFVQWWNSGAIEC